MNFGIICEFNPFHAGHKYLLESARALSAQNIVCAMSGNAVQRGELAICDKYIRAKTALENGADLVLELPFPWSASSAEYFATAGIKVLLPYCDAVIFGSECGDIDALSDAADKALSFDFCAELERRKSNGEGAAAAYFSLLEEYVGVKFSSNDVLGIEYIKAAKKLGADIKFYTVQRMGNAYRDNNIHKDKFPSASAIRSSFQKGNEEELLQLESYTSEMLKSASSQGGITDIKLLERAILMYFRLCNPAELSQYAEALGGVAERICAAARENADFESFLGAVKTKRYTDAKLSRAMLFSMTCVKRELLLQTPEYIYLLGANSNGRKLLSDVKKSKSNGVIPIVTKPADVPIESNQFKAEERLNAIFSLARENALPMGDAYKKNAFIIK
ncbi:MAG: nucleotidyltransferase family protein [Ruminococcaceae bacterium]|nr:nucleotidyltransferase family protein [Oscillospiraceae bacterium]